MIGRGGVTVSGGAEGAASHAAPQAAATVGTLLMGVKSTPYSARLRAAPTHNPPRRDHSTPDAAHPQQELPQVLHKVLLQRGIIQGRLVWVLGQSSVPFPTKDRTHRLSY